MWRETTKILVNNETVITDFGQFARLTVRLALLGRVALGAQRPIVIKLSRGRSVGLYVRPSVGLSSALWKNGRSDPDAVWHHRSDGSRDEADSAVWGSVHGKGYFWGEFGARHCNQWRLYGVRVRPVSYTHLTLPTE